MSLSLPETHPGEGSEVRVIHWMSDSHPAEGPPPQVNELVGGSSTQKSQYSRKREAVISQDHTLVRNRIGPWPVDSEQNRLWEGQAELAKLMVSVHGQERTSPMSVPREQRMAEHPRGPPAGQGQRGPRAGSPGTPACPDREAAP